uniref:Plexin-B n=1 Tax=Schistosoma mansoni TaxID=6183 RepID=A0A5K4F4Y6_SCHMA
MTNFYFFRSILGIWLYFIGLLLSLIFNSSINQLVTGIPLNFTFENDSVKQLKHSNYIQLIKFNQPSSIHYGNYEKLALIPDIPLHIDTKFPIKFYGVYHKIVKISSDGFINIGESNSGTVHGSIKVFYGVGKSGQVEVIHNDKLLTVRWPNLIIFNAHGIEMEEKAKIICTLHVNGNISIFFETIPNGVFNETEESLPGSKIYYPMTIQNYAYLPNYKKSTIKVPAFLIKSNTFIEFIPDRICSDQTSCNDCLRPGAFATKCYWCPRTKSCTNTHDIYGKMWKKGECHIQNSSDCSVQNNVQTNLIQVTRPVPTTSTIRHEEPLNVIQEIVNGNVSKHIVTDTNMIQNSSDYSVQNNVQTNLIQVTRPVPTTSTIRHEEPLNVIQDIINENVSGHIVPDTNMIQVIQINKTECIQSTTILFNKCTLLWMIATIILSILLVLCIIYYNLPNCC